MSDIVGDPNIVINQNSNSHLVEGDIIDIALPEDNFDLYFLNELKINVDNASLKYIKNTKNRYIRTLSFVINNICITFIKLSF